TSRSKILIATVLALFGSLSEGLIFVLLIPLLRSLDHAAGSAQQSKPWLPHVMQSLSIQPTLVGVLTIFLGLVACRSLINRQRDLYLGALRLDLVRDIRIGLYSDIAHANWPFLRRMRPTDLLTVLTAETERLDFAVRRALETPAQAMLIGVNAVVAFLIAPTLTLLALATGSVLAWLARNWLVETLLLGERLSAAYKNFHRQDSQFLAGLKITKSYVAEDRHVTAFAGAIDEVKDNFLSYVSSQANARLFQEIAGAGAIAVFLWISAGQLHMPVPEVLVLALILYRLLPLVRSLQQGQQQLLHSAPAAHTILDLSRECAAAREGPHDQAQNRFSLCRGIFLEHVGFSHIDDGAEAVS